DIHGIHHGGDEVASVWRSTDGGVTWGPPGGYIAVSGAQELTELDRPWFAVDNSDGPHDGRLYMSYETTPFVPIPPEVYVKHSDDQGQTWSKTVRVDDGIYETQFNARAKPIVGAGGVLYVVYDKAPITVTPFAPQTAPIHLVVARSTDAGETFEHSEAENHVHRIKSPDEATDFYTEMISAIAADPKHAGRVAIAWPEAKGNSSSRILLRYSSNGGESWSGRIDVADDSATTANQHDHVTLAWYRDGRLFVGWRDRRCCGGSFTSPYEQRVRVLNPKPRKRKRHRKATPAFKLVPGRTVRYSGPEPPNASGRGMLAPDEFQGLVATKLGVALTWSKLTGELDDLMFRRIPLRAFRPKRR
ncbi:MAG: sialidase family protein, partial [Solirubrobacterales bacterium]